MDLHNSIKYAVIILLCIIVIAYRLHLRKTSRNMVGNRVGIRPAMADDKRVTSGNGEIACNREMWSKPRLPSHLQDTEQFDPELIAHIRDKWLIPPCHTRNRKLKNPNKLDYSQYGQGLFINHFLKNRRNGFFIECGAHDGETFSNTLFLEKSREWSGLLVEADPNRFASLARSYRQTYIINCCLSPINRSSTFNFTVLAGNRTVGNVPGLTKQRKTIMDSFTLKSPSQTSDVQMQCFPIYSILAAIGVLTVDLLVLDVEGAEEDILKNIPFHKLSVDLIMVEYIVPGNPRQTKSRWNQIQTYLGMFGYGVVEKFPRHTDILMYKRGM